MNLKSNFMQNYQNLPEEWINNYTDELFSRAVYKLSDVENIHSFKQKNNPKTWLFSILNNKISDFYGRKYREDKKINTDISSFFTAKGNWKPDKYNSAIKMKYYSEKVPEEICHEPEINSTNMW